MIAASALVDKLSDARRLWGGEPAAIFADGGSIGGPIIDRMMQLGVENIIEIMFGSAAEEKDKWGNKRAEMWARMRNWLEIGCLDGDQQLYDDLIAPELLIKKNSDVFILESKEDMKARGLPSTDDGDALALTFAHPVVARVQNFVPLIETPIMDTSVGY